MASRTKDVLSCLAELDVLTTQQQCLLDESWELHRQSMGVRNKLRALLVK